jgi:hypothetical protein
MKSEKKRSYRHGRLFLRGNTWWITWCYNGKEQRESSNSTNKIVEASVLNRRLGELQEGIVQRRTNRRSHSARWPIFFCY